MTELLYTADRCVINDAVCGSDVQLLAHCGSVRCYIFDEPKATHTRGDISDNWHSLWAHSLVRYIVCSDIISVLVHLLNERGNLNLVLFILLLLALS